MKKKNLKAKCFLALLSMGVVASPLTTHAAAKTTTVPKSANMVVGDTITINGKLPYSTNTVKVTSTNKNVTVKSVSKAKKKTAFSVKIQSNKVGSSKLKVRTYRGKRLTSTKYINLKIKSATLNTKAKTVTAGKSFTLSMPGVKSKLSVTNGDKKALKVTRKTNNSFTVKALKGTKKPVSLKIKLGKKTYTCKVTTKCKKHNYDKGKVTVKPTCTKRGRKTYTCKDCGQFYHKTLKTLDHNYKSTITKAPTCTSEGEKKYTCKACGKSYTEVMEKIAHNYVSAVTKEATCTEEGTVTYTCSSCGDSYTKSVVAMGHAYDEGVVTKEATCTEDGVKTYTCGVCGATYNEAISATGHTWNEGTIIKEPTCTETGLKQATCTVCGVENDALEIPKTPHTYESKVIQNQSCTADEITKDTCTVCGQEKERVTKKATGHHFDNGTITKQPTCTETGLKTFHCTNEGCTETREESVAATGHSYNQGVVTKQPTCTEEGIKTFTCQTCGDSYTEKMAKVEHEWETEKRQEKTTVKVPEYYTSEKFTTEKYGEERSYYNCEACKQNATDNNKPYYKSKVFYCDKCKSLFYSLDTESAYKEIQSCDGHSKHQYDYEETNKNTDETGKFYGDVYGGGRDGMNTAATTNAHHVNDCPKRIYYSENGTRFGESGGEDTFWQVTYYPTEWNYKTVTYRVCKNCKAEEKVK